MNKINVILKRAGSSPKPISIENDLSDMEEIVEGPIAVLRLGQDICLICNLFEHQLVMNKNIRIDENIIHGNIFFVRAFQGGFASLNVNDFSFVTSVLNRGTI